MRFEDAKKNALEKVWEIEKRAKEIIGGSEAQIFEIHAMLLEDEDLNDSIIDEIKKGKSAEDSIELASSKYARTLIDIGDEYLSGRASDIKDVANQLIKALDKNENSIEDTIIKC